VQCEEAIEHVQHVTTIATLDEFNTDWRKQWLVARGNVLRHEYGRTAHDVLWAVARDDLPQLASVCRQEAATEQRGETGKT
jgi:uncharacterized protein with HEPN domain